MFVFGMCCVCVYVKAAVSAEGEEVAVSEEIGQEEEKETRWQQAIEAQRRYVSIGMCMLVCRGSGERGRSKIAGVAMVRATAWSGGDGGQGRGRGWWWQRDGLREEAEKENGTGEAEAEGGRGRVVAARGRRRRGWQR